MTKEVYPTQFATTKAMQLAPISSLNFMNAFGHGRLFYFRGSLDERLLLTDLFESRTFVHGQMGGLVAVDQILRFVLRGVDSVSLERDFRGNFFLDYPPDSACFRVPLNMITNFEVLCHWFDLL